jgi:hypothetical protein
MCWASTSKGPHPDRQCRRLVWHEFAGVSRILRLVSRGEGVRPAGQMDQRARESFVSDSHGRDHEMSAELALDAAGNFLAV